MFNFTKKEPNEIDMHNEIADRNSSDIVMSSSTDSNSDLMYQQDQDSKSDFLKWQQSLDQEYGDLIMILKGYKKDYKNNTWKKTEGSKPLCNDYFIDSILTPMFQPFISRAMPNTMLKTNDINIILRYSYNDLVNSMVENYDKNGISKENLDIVLRFIKNTMKVCIQRAVNGFTKKRDSSMTKIVETNSNIHREKPKHNYVSSLLGFGGDKL